MPIAIRPLSLVSLICTQVVNLTAMLWFDWNPSSWSWNDKRIS